MGTTQLGKLVEDKGLAGKFCASALLNSHLGALNAFINCLYIKFHGKWDESYSFQLNISTFGRNSQAGLHQILQGRQN
jgi:hypothetical protein